MKSISLTHIEPEIDKVEMIDFYNEATEDYEFWSNDFNMHFGYFRPVSYTHLTLPTTYSV